MDVVDAVSSTGAIGTVTVAVTRGIMVGVCVDAGNHLSGKSSAIPCWSAALNRSVVSLAAVTAGGLLRYRLILPLCSGFLSRWYVRSARWRRRATLLASAEVLGSGRSK